MGKEKATKRRRPKEKRHRRLSGRQRRKTLK